MIQERWVHNIKTDLGGTDYEHGVRKRTNSESCLLAGLNLALC
jgi:hypothetical protein